jgi:uncharacterized membrane protein YtjA (UPF0391 family)
VLNWALAFLVASILMAILGFGGVTGEIAYIFKVFFVIFLTLFVTTLMAGRPWEP